MELQKKAVKVIEGSQNGKECESTNCEKTVENKEVF